MTLYKIANWSELYENHRSRILKRLLWIPVSTQMDGDGFTDLLSHPQGVAHFGAWILLLEIAAKCDPRGVLVRSGGIPRTPGDIARVCRADPALFSDAMARLVEIGWITSEPFVVKDMALPGADPALPGDKAAETSAYITVHNSTEQEEQNITGRERVNGAPDLWSIFWDLFVISGKALGDRDKERAMRLWLNYDPPEQQRILTWAMNQAKSVWSSERYTPMPASALESKGWTRIAAERLIPDPRPKSATDEAFEIVKRGWKS